MRLRATALVILSFLIALVLSALVAGGSATIIEKRSRLAMKVAMESAGFGWAQVQTDGLQVIISGAAPSEADRFRALTRAGAVVDAARIVDDTDVQTSAAIAPPDFSLEMLRNEDGVSLIGLVPASDDQTALVDRITSAAKGAPVTDMLESADAPTPDGWTRAVDFAVEALTTVPRAKISVTPGAVRIEAIADSPSDKSRIETSLARRRPADLLLVQNVSAPHPVIAPFTLRFLIDDAGARFDACSADTERARERILAAARAAGATGTLSCAIGMGAPSPQWAEAVARAIAALREIGSGVVSFADTDIFLSANPEVPAATYDRVIGDLESNLPAAFSLRTELQKKPEKTEDAPEFVAELSQDGTVELRGRVTDARNRAAAENFARALFGADAVRGATRIDGQLPQGWPVRTLAALEALGALREGTVSVSADQVRVTGVSGDSHASDTIARELASRLGEGARMSLSVRYDPRLDPALALPDGGECAARLNNVLAKGKISFEPGSAVIANDAAGALDALAAAMKDCEDFRMEVGGHTDSQGRDEMNMALSQQRAEAVIAALSSRRVLTANLIARGYGETRPVASNDTEAGREANRRIEFTLLDSTPVGGSAAAPASAATKGEDPAAAAPAAAAAGPASAEPAPTEDAPSDAPNPEDDPQMDDTSMDGAPMDDTSMAGAPMDGAHVDGAPVETGAGDAPAGAGDQPTQPAAEAPDEPPATETAPGTADAPSASSDAASAQDQTADEITEAGIPVADAAQSPARPKARPANLKPRRGARR